MFPTVFWESWLPLPTSNKIDPELSAYPSPLRMTTFPPVFPFPPFIFTLPPFDETPSNEIEEVEWPAIIETEDPPVELCPERISILPLTSLLSDVAKVTWPEEKEEDPLFKIIEDDISWSEDDVFICICP